MKKNGIDNYLESRNLFRDYYRTSFGKENIFPKDTKFRHFRLEIFSRKKRRFLRLKDIYHDQIMLKEKIIKVVPKNAYYTPVKWLNPIYVSKTKDELDVMLTSPLYFDVDGSHLPIKSFDSAKRMAQRLIDYIYDNYSKSHDLIIFSGRQGFHIYYWNWDTELIIKMSPSKRLECFIQKRNKLLKELENNNIIVDQTVTPDPYRILKISHTLHGTTGLIAKPVKKLSEFNPIKQCLAFTIEKYETIFNLDFSFFE